MNAPNIYGDMDDLAWRQQCYRWAWAHFGVQYGGAELYFKWLCRRLQAELLLQDTPVWTDADANRLSDVMNMLRDNRDGIRRVDDLGGLIRERSALEDKRDVYHARAGATREALAQARTMAAQLDKQVKLTVDKTYKEQREGSH